MKPIRLTAVMTHPVQYLAPWFRHLAAHAELELTVLYAVTPTPEQQGIGYGHAFTWDVPLLEGYHAEVVRPGRAGDDVGSQRFFGLDVPQIARSLRSTRPDVAMIQGWHSVTLMRALLACRRTSIPVVYRGDSTLESGRGGALWRGRTWALLRLFSAWLAVGQRADRYLASFGLPRPRTFASPHCVDNARFAAAAAPHRTPEGCRAARAAFGIAPDAFVPLFVGKFDDNKRVDDLLAAAGDAHVLVVGAGPAEARLRALARAQRVTFAGFLNQTELGRAHGAADCLVLPSARETWGLVVNEALAAGLPCVVSDGVGCAPDLVTAGETGEQFPAGDVAALSNALARVRTRLAAGHDFAPACGARAAAHSFAAASEGLVAACRVLAER
jgi:glycosyltransferase involved in cell wall biosynthesis